MNLRLGDIRTIDLPEDYYDGIWAFASLLNMPKPDLKKLLPKLRNALKKKGSLFISVKEGEGEIMIPDVAGRRLFSFYKLEEFKKILEEKGFKVVFSNNISDYDLTNRNKDKQKPGWVIIMGIKE